MKAILVEEHGGSDKLRLRDVDLPAPGPGEAVVRIVAAGVNFMDTGVRADMYWRDRPLPITLGVEGAGRVTAVGAAVDDVRVGDRVAWFYVPGSYAEAVVAPAASLVPLPPDIDDETAAGLMMQGLTASHFVTETYAIKPGDIALVHAAAGGVGLMLTQIIKLLGGTVIGRVSSAEKAEIALAAGADHVVIDADAAFAPEVLALTGGEGVHVVYDGTGADSFPGSLAVLRHHGVLAYYGQTIKRLPPIDLLDLPKSVLVTYPAVMHHVRSRAALLARAGQLFEWVRSGRLRVRIDRRYPLGEAAQSHRDLEARRTAGKLLLIP